jgi:hypothetical protein
VVELNPLTLRDNWKNIIPTFYQAPDAREKTIAYLAAMQQRPAIREQLYRYWAQEMGVEVTDPDIEAVRAE